MTGGIATEKENIKTQRSKEREIFVKRANTDLLI